MRIVIFNWKDCKNPDAGGAEILISNIVKSLIRDGHDVTWFCREFSGCRKEEISNGSKIIRRGNRFTVYFEAWKYFSSLKDKPDLVIESVNTICWQTPLYVSAKKRVILVNQLAREVFFYELPPIASHLAFALEKWEYFFYKTSKIVCFSKSVKNDLSSFGIPKENISIFSIGLNRAQYAPGKKSKDLLFLFVGRLAKMKRPDLCIRAMETIIKTYPRAKLVIIGFGPEKNSLEKLISKLKLEKNVLVLTEVSEKEKTRFMQKAWALLLPSVKEGWGMVVTEAAACGTLSIVTNVSGLKDAVVNGKTGIILSENPTPEEISKSILEITQDKHLFDKLSGQALIHAKQFSWKKCYLDFKKAIKL